MRKLFIEVSTIEEAQESAPWAAEIVQVDGGFMAFESETDADNFKNQN